MSRINRRNWTGYQMGILSRGGMLDLFDNAIKEALRITDDEFDQLIEDTSEDVWNDLFFKEHPTFAEGRVIIQTLNQHINYEKD